MNQYATLAQRHWKRWLPSRYSQIPDPNRFFTTLGEETAAQIHQLSDQLAGEDQPAETYMGKLGRLNGARRQAEEIVLAESILLPPEAGVDPDLQTDLDHSMSPTDRDRIPLVEDLTHPWWRQSAVEEQNLSG